MKMLALLAENAPDAINQQGDRNGEASCADQRIDNIGKICAGDAAVIGRGSLGIGEKATDPNGYN